jgi:regulator of sigma E protease
MTTVLAFIVVVGVLIFVHELGHFLVARLLGVRVEVFSLGFGPKLFGFIKGETEYRISAVPLGGYVKLYGEHPETVPSVVDKEKAFAFKKPWQKALIVLAGPGFNFLFALLAFWLYFSISGPVYLKPVVGKVIPGSPAEAVGLKPGDEILAIDGKEIETFERLFFYLRSKEDLTEVELKVKRGNEVFTLRVKPASQEGTNIFGKKTKVPVLGIAPSGEVIKKEYNPFSAFVAACEKFYELTSLTLLAMGKLLTGDLPLSTLGGPLTIGKLAGDTAKVGLFPLIAFMAMLSINLGLINLFPIPMLDGGHLVIFAIEAVRGQPLSLRAQELIFKVGLALIILLSVFVFYNDIMRLLSGWKLD